MSSPFASLDARTRCGELVPESHWQSGSKDRTDALEVAWGRGPAPP